MGATSALRLVDRCQRDASRAIYTLDEVDGGTRVTLDAEHRLKGFVMKFMSPFIRWILTSERAKEMERLRKVLEKA